MIRTEGTDVIDSRSLFEIDIDKHGFIAEAYRIHAVPTLISKSNILTGLPSVEELKSFLLQSIAGGVSQDNENRPRSVIRPVSENPDETTHIERLIQ
jgi:hypothetical protein